MKKTDQGLQFKEIEFHKMCLGNLNLCASFVPQDLKANIVAAVEKGQNLTGVNRDQYKTCIELLVKCYPHIPIRERGPILSALEIANATAKAMGIAPVDLDRLVGPQSRSDFLRNSPALRIHYRR